MMSILLIFTTPSMCLAAPANDNFSVAELISGQAGSVNGTTVAATRESGEPNHAGYSSNGSVWYRWTAPADGLFKFTLSNTGYGSLLAVYGGSQLTSLIPITSTYAGGQGAVTFPVTSGNVYQVVVDNTWSGSAFVLSWAVPPPPPGNDFFSGAGVIAGQAGSVSGTTVSATRESGEPYHVYSGYGSVWYRWTAPADGLIRFTAPGGTLLAVYQGSQVTSLAPIASNSGYPQSSVSFAVTSGSVFQIAVDSPVSGGVDFVLNWSVPPPPPGNDNFAGAAVIAGPTGSVGGTTVEATREPGEPYPGSFFSYGSVWYRWTAPADGWFKFFASSNDIGGFYLVLGAFSGNQVTGLTPLPPRYFGQTDSITFAATSGTVYHIAVASSLSSGAGFVMDWEMIPPPPANDSFASAEPLGASSSVFVSGTWRSATSEASAGEPDLSSSDFWENDRTVWYSWTAPAGVSWARVKSSGTNLRNQLAVYVGGGLGSLTPLRLNERTIREPNRCTFPVSPGVTYQIRLAVEGYAEYELPFLEVPDFTFDLQLQAIGNPATAAEYILRGRGQLEEGSPSALVQAKSDFAAALALESANQEAAVLLGLAQLLALEGETGFTVLLGNLGIPATGSLREGSLPVPEDLDGFPVFAPGANSSLGVDWLVTHVLPRLVNVRSAMDGVTQNSFRTDLTSSEAGIPEGDTFVDRGDALAMRAGTRALEMLIHLLSTYQLAAPLNDVVDLDRQGVLSAERVLQTYQNLVAFSASDRRLQFADALRQLNNDYLAAAVVIRQLREAGPADSLGAASSRLDEQDDDRLRSDLSQAVESLDHEVLIRSTRVNLSRFLATSQPLRAWLPTVRGNDAAGPLPDLTLDGILPGNTQLETDNRLYELGRLWGMGQYATDVGEYLEWFGLASAPGEDADGDGKSNFNEWIFASDPASGEVMYQAGLQQLTDANGQREIRFSFIRSIYLKDWKLVVAVSDDLADWDDTEAMVEPVGAAVPTGDGFSEVATYRLRAQQALPLRQYFRVETRPKP